MGDLRKGICGEARKQPNTQSQTDRDKDKERQRWISSTHKYIQKFIETKWLREREEMIKKWFVHTYVRIYVDKEIHVDYIKTN